MSILLISDTHYNCSDQSPIILENFLNVINQLDFDLVVHCGDWISHDCIDEFPKVLKMFRKYINKPILTVLGNHDIWHDNKELSYEDIMSYIRDQFKQYDIHYLTDKHYAGCDYLITGFDGWYCNPFPPTNDFGRSFNFIGDVDLHRFMKKKSDKEAENLLDFISEYADDCRTLVCASHFHANYEFGNNPVMIGELARSYDLLLFGHSHRRSEYDINGVNVYNCGSDYEYPRFTII